MRTLVCAAACLLASAPALAQVVRVSVSTAGVEGNSASQAPAMSADGRYVVFVSWASNLVADDTNGRPDVFLRDRDTDADGIFDEPGGVATTRLSVTSGGSQTTGNSVSAPAISANGRYVTFVSDAPELPGVPDAARLFRLDRQSGTIVRVPAPGYDYALSPDGAFVVHSAPEGLMAVDVASGTPTVLIPTPPPPVSLPLQTIYGRPTISADGRTVAALRVRAVTFRVDPTDVAAVVVDRTTGVSADVPTPVLPRSVAVTASGNAVVLHGRSAGVWRRVLASGAETPVRALAPSFFPPIFSLTGRYVVGDDGQLVDLDLGTATPLGLVPAGGAFDTSDRWLAVGSGTDTLVAGDTNGTFDIFVLDVPDVLDADNDTMDDRWETIFGVTDPAADPDTDGQTNAQEEDAGTHPNGLVRRFLAEGATGAFFHTTIGLANPNPTLAAAAVLTFDKGDGTRVRRTVAVPAGRSVSVDVGAVTGLESADVSTTVDSDRFLAVERGMAWGSSAINLYGSHAETATTAPSATWFLAEGSTVVGFELFYLLQNPQTSTTTATVRFLLPSGTTITRTYNLAANSRTTIYVNQIDGLAETDVSGDISATAPIVVERAMYRNLPGEPFGLGHDSMGVTAATPSWFFAEGATGTFFDLYVLMANPGDADAIVRADYARPDGSVVTQTYDVRAHSRFSVYVDAIPGLEATAVATTLTSTNTVPIVAERAMYWPGGFFDYYEGHSSAGSTTTALAWLVAGAESGGTAQAQTYVLIANTENRAGQARIRLLPDVNSTAPPPPPVEDLVVPLLPNSRTTVPFGVSGLYGVLVTSTGAAPVQLVVESAVYRTVGGVTWAAGSNALATPVP